MKKDEVKVGGVYVAKVSDKLTRVRIDGVNPHGGWDATNVATDKKVRVKSAQRLRGEAGKGKKQEAATADAKAALVAPTATKKTESAIQTPAAELRPYRCGDRVEMISDATAAARNLARGEKAWVLDESARSQAKAPTPIPAGEERKQREKKAVATDKAEGQAAAKEKTAAKEPQEYKPGGLDCAVRVLREAGKPLNCKQMVETMLSKGYWQTGGKTPEATIYAAIIREIATRKGEARFKKTDRGMFTLNP